MGAALASGDTGLGEERGLSPGNRCLSCFVPQGAAAQCFSEVSLPKAWGPQLRPPKLRPWLQALLALAQAGGSPAPELTYALCSLPGVPTLPATHVNLASPTHLLMYLTTFRFWTR